MEPTPIADTAPAVPAEPKIACPKEAAPMQAELAPAPPAPEPPKEPTFPPVLLGRQHDISGFASQDETRSIINGIHYNAKGRFIEATDGRMLIRVPVHQLREDDGYPKTTAGHGVAHDCIIPTKEFVAGLKIIPKKGTIAVMSYAKLTTAEKPAILESEPSTISPDRAVIVAANLDGEQSVSSRVIEGNYPNTQQVIPTDEPKAKICLSPHLLKKIVDYACKHGHEKVTGLLFEWVDELSPMRISFKLSDPMEEEMKAQIVLMPMRMS